MEIPFIEPAILPAPAASSLSPFVYVRFEGEEYCVRAETSIKIPPVSDSGSYWSNVLSIEFSVASPGSMLKTILEPLYLDVESSAIPSFDTLKNSPFFLLKLIVAALSPPPSNLVNLPVSSFKASSFTVYVAPPRVTVAPVTA